MLIYGMVMTVVMTGTERVISFFSSLNLDLDIDASRYNGGSPDKQVNLDVTKCDYDSFRSKSPNFSLFK